MDAKLKTLLLQPTPEIYAELQKAFDHFNSSLFESALPDCLITLQRERRTYGYFSTKRFARLSGEMVDEIAMNPSYFGIRTLRDTLSTLAHEMVHGWQLHFGKPGRGRYHNAEWGRKMEAIGLMPTSTGEPGGKKIGDQMTHYIIDGGPFAESCQALLTTEFKLSWLDRFPPERPKSIGGLDTLDPDDESESEDDVDGVDSLIELPPVEPISKSNRIKYRCAKCGVQVWGKPKIRVLCGGEECAAALLHPAD